MEKITSKIEQLLEEKLHLYQKLNQLIVDERQAIVNIDVDALWKNTGTKKQLTDEIVEVRNQILRCVQQKFGMASMDGHPFSLSHLIRTLPLGSDDKLRLRQIKLAIEEQKSRLTQSAQDNKNYVGQYLSVIDEIMASVVNNSGNSQYTRIGSVPDSKTQRCLIHAEV